MHDTAFHVAPENRSRLAANYRRAKDKSLRLVDDPETSTYLQEPTFFSGGGGLTSTMADYLRFARCCAAAASSTGRASWGPARLS